jgi:hypothetical protein
MEEHNGRFDRNGGRAMSGQDGVRWPTGHEPAGASIYVINQTISAAPPEAVWAWLVRPDRWNEYYSNASQASSVSGAWPEVELGSEFTWATGRIPVKTTVTEFEPFQRLAWTGEGLGATGHHAWILTPTSEGGTLILTEETQRGLILRLLRPVLRRSMSSAHQQWVEGLARRAESNQQP